MNTINFYRLDDVAILPLRGTDHSCGLDLFSAEDLVLHPGARAGVRTGVAVGIPSGFYGKVAPRSGLAISHGIDTLAGVIDSDYRGEIICVLINLGSSKYSIESGNRIAQLIIQPYENLVPVWETLDETARGSSGFGSTGK